MITTNLSWSKSNRSETVICFIPQVVTLFSAENFKNSINIKTSYHLVYITIFISSLLGFKADRSPAVILKVLYLKL